MVADEERDATSIFLLRHTLMSPWLRAPIVETESGSRNYIDLYWEYLEEVIDAALDEI